MLHFRAPVIVLLFVLLRIMTEFKQKNTITTQKENNQKNTTNEELKHEMKPVTPLVLQLKSPILAVGSLGSIVAVCASKHSLSL